MAEVGQWPSAASLVDIGCGNGVFAVAAASQFPDCAVLALDSLSSAVEETKRRASLADCKNLRAEVASADVLPIPDSSADRILMRNVAHHLSSLDAALAEVKELRAALLEIGNFGMGENHLHDVEELEGIADKALTQVSRIDDFGIAPTARGLEK